jgi:hypothetical protein
MTRIPDSTLRLRAKMLYVRRNDNELVDDYGSDHPSYYEASKIRPPDDEELYCHALLYAGDEPTVGYHGSHDGYETRYYADPDDLDKHMSWQLMVAEVIMTCYRRNWWFEWLTGEKMNGAPEYRLKAERIWADVQKDELRRFYTWLCKQRGEAWTERIS